VGGVRGTGILAVPQSISLLPTLHGGGQERALRPGTESVAGAVAFSVALCEARENREAFSARAERAREYLLTQITDIKNLEVNQGKNGVAHILNISLIDRDTDYLAALLDEAGFAVSTKSACETDSTEGSRAVFALTGDKARASSTLRISWGPKTTERELERFVEAIKDSVAFLDENRA
jgi:cysteine desulfurase